MASELLLPKNPQQQQRSLIISLLISNLITLSVCLSFVALHRPLTHQQQQQQLPQWVQKAATLAEEAASARCSGHGRAFIDSAESKPGNDEQMHLSCECNSCFTGERCSEKVSNCEVNADGGDPLFLEPFWEANAESGTVVVSPSHRMSYITEPSSTAYVTRSLEEHIRKVHKLVGNALIEGRHIVIGSGSTQLINAAIESLAPQTDSQPPAVVVSRAPYYQAYKFQPDFFSSKRYSWGGDPLAAAEKFSGKNVTMIEILASPNNPDSSMQKSVLGVSKNTVYDRAYYWPHFAPITEALQDDIMLFTLSKLTGHAGSRLGWAIVKDPDVYQRMHTYVWINTIGVSHDTQVRARQLLKAVIEGYADHSPASVKPSTPAIHAREQHIFHFGAAAMALRWKRFEQLFANTERFSLQPHVSVQHCNFFAADRAPSPAYAFVQCKQDGDCYESFRKAGAVGRAGPQFGVDASFVRFTLLKRDDDFDALLERLAAFVQGS